MSQFYLVAPSGYCINQQAAARGVERLQQAGHEVAHQQVIPRRQQRFAGTEHERLADINQLAQLPGRNRIVLAVRGGYGASRLLPHIDWQGLVARQQRDPLLICGHSDFTAIQSGLLAMGNVITFSGPMLAGNFGAETLDPFTEHHFWQALRQPEFTLEWPGEGPNCRVEGTLWGKSGDADLAYRHAVATGNPRRHPGGGGYQRAPVPRRAHAASAVAQRRAGGAESGDLRQLHRQRAERL